MKVLFIVEGLEELFIEEVCGRAAIVKYHGGGETYSTRLIAIECLRSIVRHKDEISHIVIWADLDRSALSPEDYEAEFRTILTEELTQRGLAEWSGRVTIGVPNTTFENWLYAALSGTNIDGDKYPQHLDTHLGTKYKKGKHGRELSKGIKGKMGNALASPSFARFAQKMPQGICPGLDNALGR